MKNIRKTKNGLFICEECNKAFKSKTGLTNHIKHNLNFKDYYDKWHKSPGEEFCKICKKPVEFRIGFKYLYNNTCSKKCSIIYTRQQTVKSQIEKYGGPIGFGTEYFKKKTIETCKEKYGVTNIFQTPENNKKRKIGVQKYHKDPIKSKRAKEKYRQN